MRDVRRCRPFLFKAHGAGSCDGGSSLLAYKFMHDYGITDDTCSPYMAVDYYQMSEAPCEDTMCRTCDLFNTCYQVKATKHYVSEYGSIAPHDIHGMMAEIFARGPISCAIYAHSASFEKYKGGIIDDPTKYPYTTHCISLVGWGETEQGQQYWVGRNSFGTNWGEDGWFLIERGTNCLLIESACDWGVPA